MGLMQESKKSKFLAFMREARKRSYETEHFDKIINKVERLSLKQFLMLESKLTKIIKNHDMRYGSMTQLTKQLRAVFD